MGTTTRREIQLARAGALHGGIPDEGLKARQEVNEAIVAALPPLRAFAISLTRDGDRADDLVHDAVLSALIHLHQFERGTSMQAWLFTILRNRFRSLFRRQQYEIEDPDGVLAREVAIPPEQNGHLELEDLQNALSKLPIIQREALLLVAANGMTYEEAASVCGTKAGTVKSRVNRARTTLTKLLERPPLAHSQFEQALDRSKEANRRRLR